MGSENATPYITDSMGRKQYPLYINESGLYALIINSNLPSAKKFKHWVTSEVIPSLRKNGGYIVGQENMSDEQLISNALVVANRILAERDAKIKELSPKAEYFDKLVSRNLLTNFRDTAKELHISPKTFVQWLEDKEYIYRDINNKIKPYADYVKSGLFEEKDFTAYNGYSDVQTLITVKGKETFRLLLEV